MFRISTWTVLYSLVANVCLAAPVESLLDMTSRKGGGAEYSVGGSPGINITVNLIGGVKSPGIYHLPENTDVLTLIGYGGGTTDDAKMGDVVIKRRKADGYQKIDVDLKDLISSTDNANQRVSNGDVIYVPQSKSTQNLTLVLGVVTSVLSIVLAGYTVSKLKK